MRSAAILTIALAGCASTPATIEVPRTVEVPVVRPCVPPGTPEAPKVSSKAELAALSDYDIVLRLASERYELAAYAVQVAGVIRACR